MNMRRINGFAALARLVGLGRGNRVVRGWCDALADRPELVADLAMLGFLDEAAIRVRGGRPAPLPADELQFREGARSVVRAIFDRAGVTNAEIMMAMQELDNEDDLADALRGDRARQ